MISSFKNRTTYPSILFGPILILLAVATFAFVFQRFIAHEISGNPFNWIKEISSNSFIFLSMGLFMPLIQIASDHFPLNKNTLRNAVLHVLFALIFAVAHLILVSNINVWRFDIDFGRISKKLFQNFFHIQIICYWAILGILLTFRKSKKNIPDKATLLSVKSGRHGTQIPIDGIHFLQSFDHYVKIYDGKKVWVMRVTLNEITKSLNSNFIRIHRGTVINIQFIQDINPCQNSRYEVVMKNGHRVFSSRKHKEIIRNYLSSKSLAT